MKLSFFFFKTTKA